MGVSQFKMLTGSFVVLCTHKLVHVAAHNEASSLNNIYIYVNTFYVVREQTPPRQ